MRSNVTPEQFVEIWQQAKSVGEVARQAEMSPGCASARATLYRQKGVELKYFRVPKIDWERLAKLAEESK